MMGALGDTLLFDLDGRSAGLLDLPYGAHDVQGLAKAPGGIDDDRNIDGRAAAVVISVSSVTVSMASVQVRVAP